MYLTMSVGGTVASTLLQLGGVHGKHDRFFLHRVDVLDHTTRHQVLPAAIRN